MTKYRRNRVQGGTYFFTVTLLDRRSQVLTRHIEALRTSVRKVKDVRPFHIDAWVVLPDHMHCIWSLPEGDSDFSGRWREIKKAFVRQLPKTELIPLAKRERGERGIWQRRFWEHTIMNDLDYQRHIDYVHLNPYKHGLVAHVRDWPYSSFHRYVRAGIYPEDWLTDGVDIDGGERQT